MDVQTEKAQYSNGKDTDGQEEIVQGHENTTPSVTGWYQGQGQNTGDTTFIAIVTTRLC